MNAPTRDLKAKLWERHADEWYAEPHWCSRRLFDVCDFSGGILDPACGRGNILESARSAGLDAIGFDLVERGGGGHGFDFLDNSFPAECAMPVVGEVKHIVSNPPFEKCREFALKALDIVGVRCRVAMIFPTRRLNAAGAWLRFTPLTSIYYLTPRPSMPPGEIFEALLKAGKTPSGGKQDFCWLIWQRGYIGPPSVSWLHRDKRGAA